MLPRLIASALLALAVLLPASAAFAQDAPAPAEADLVTAPPAESQPVPPAPPTSVNVTAGDGSVAVTWAEPAGGPPASGYTITARTGDTVAASVSAGAATRSATLNGLRNGVAYVVAVTAISAEGLESPAAEAAPVTPRNPTPDAVTKLVLRAGRTTAVVTWVDPRDADLSGVEVRVVEGAVSAFSRTTGTLGCRAAPGVGRCALSGLAEGKSYTVTVHAVDRAGQWGPGTSAVLRGTTASVGAQRAKTVGRQPLAVRGRISPAPAAGSRVAVEARTQRLDRTWGGWSAVGEASTAVDGAYTLTHRPNRNVQYRVRFLGAGGHLGSTSSTTTVHVVPAPFATASGVALHPVSANTVVTGFHQANAGTRAVTMSPTDLHFNNFKGKLSIARSPLHTTLIMPSRGRGTAATSAVDIAVPRGETVRSPVTGRVRAVSSYRLYGSTSDQIVMITPEGRGDLDVAVLHIASPKVRVGQRVVAGQTPVATARLLPFGSQIDRWAGRVPHVHVDVRRR